MRYSEAACAPSTCAAVLTMRSSTSVCATGAVSWPAAAMRTSAWRSSSAKPASARWLSAGVLAVDLPPDPRGAGGSPPGEASWLVITMRLLGTRTDARTVAMPATAYLALRLRAKELFLLGQAALHGRGEALGDPWQALH